MQRPRFYYDAGCRFCRLWVARWEQTTGDAVEYVPFGVGEKKKSSEFVAADGTASIGAEGVFRLLATGSSGRLLSWYRRVPPFAWASEIGYRIVSSCRACAWKLTGWMFKE